MGYEIELPWSCKTQDKVLNVIKWTWLFQPLFTLPYITYFANPFINEFGFALLFIGLAGIVSWLYQFGEWYVDDKLPSFSCRTKGESSHAT